MMTERVKDCKVIQGGGSGEGFKSPRHLLEENDITIKSITSDIVNAVESANPSAFQNDGNNDKEIWTRELLARLCHQPSLSRESVPIHHRRLEPPSLSGSEPFASSMNAKRSFTSMAEELEVLQVVQPNMGLRGARSNRIQAPNPFENLAQQIQDGPSTSFRRPVCNATRIIPKLPKSIEELVQLWRHGSKDKFFKPIWIFEKVEERKRAAPQYTDAWWKSSGQKCAFLRMKRIVAKLVHLIPDSTTSQLFSGESDRYWEAAVQAFHKKWDVGGIPPSLSVVERN